MPRVHQQPLRQYRKVQRQRNLPAGREHGFVRANGAVQRVDVCVVFALRRVGGVRSGDVDELRTLRLLGLLRLCAAAVLEQRGLRRRRALHGGRVHG